MLAPEAIARVRRLHLRARKLVRDGLVGEYHSAFRGAGLSFEDVREYSPGDDVRTIDWNVTARTGQPFVKRYVEERELTVLLAVDVSASQRFGTRGRTKRAVAAELAALVALCAAGNGDRVGLLAFTDRVERYVRPGRGPRHVLRLLRDVLAFEPAGRGTDLGAALDYVDRVQRRRALVFLFGDFLDESGTEAFRRTARRHELIAVRTADAREAIWPNVGLVELEDAEGGDRRAIDARSEDFRAAFAAGARGRRDAFARLLRETGTDGIEADTEGDHFGAMVAFFRRRGRKGRRG